ncbi:MAG: glycosyltransferase involved in cell wall biosynthesis [Flavobacterium sp.]|jgi:glycosyltransferase involved in cell wall biosynthesis
MAITIGIPFYNAESYLGDAIRSVFAQTYQDWELILIDDGSTDRSLEIARSVDDARVRVYSDGKNRKLASRLNEIVKLAKYDLIARMDADDLMASDRLEKQIKILTENPKIDLVSTGLYSISDKMELKGARWHSSKTISFDEILHRKGCGVVHAAVLGRKKWFERNPYDINLKVAQDYELWVRTSFKNDFKIYLIQFPLYFYREEGSVSAEKVLLSYINEKKMYKLYSPKNYRTLALKLNLKTVIVKFLKSINKFDFIVQKRSHMVSDLELIKIFEKEIIYNKSIKVKGLINV